jgi:serine/threonine protein kinase
MRQIDTAGLALAHGRVHRADASWPEVRPGDRLVAVAGVRGPLPYVRPLLTEAPLTGAAAITLARDGREFTVPVVTRPLPPHHALSLAGRLLAGGLCVVLGALCFLLRPGVRLTWLFLLFTTSLAVMLLVMVGASRYPTWYAHLLHASFALSGSLGVHLLGFELPVRRRGARSAWVMAAIYAPAIAIIVTGVTLPVAEAMHHWVWGSAWSIVGGAIVTGILTAGWLRARGRDHDLARQHAWLLVGVSVGLWLPLIVFLGRTLSGAPYEKWLVHLNAVPVLVYPALTATAVLRFNALGADRLTAALVNYLLAIGAIAMTCVLGLVAIPLAVERFLPASPLVRVLLTATTAAVMMPVYRGLRRRLDRRYLRVQVDQEAPRRALAELARLVSAGDSAAALAAAQAALQVLHAEHLELWLLGPSGEAYHRQGGWGRPGADSVPVPREGALGAALRVDRVWGIAAFTATAMPPAAQARLGERRLAMVAPIPMYGVISGFVGLGVRRSGLPYDEAEEGYVATVGAQIGIALERQHGEGAVGAYRIERRLGVGGSAEVHLAWQVGPGGFERRVALKRPLPRAAIDADQIAMFLHEARVAAALDHPGIAQIIEIGRHRGGYFIAMEYVEGRPLRAVLRAHGGALPLAMTLAVVVPLLEALAYAHAACDAHGRWLRVVHRDVTPNNVLIGDRGEVKLVDFGIARSAARAAVTQTGVVRGTPAYMSPEQTWAQPLDARSDLYSVGVLLVECLGGGPPGGRAPRSKVEVLTALDATLPPALTTVVRRALAEDPDDRYASADEMRAALLAACAPVAPADREQLAAWLRAQTPEPDERDRAIPTTATGGGDTNLEAPGR